MDHDHGMDMGMMMSPPPSSMPMPMHNMKMMMHMTFFWGTHVDILFSGWPGDRGLGAYILALFSVFALALLVECLSFIHLRLSLRSHRPGLPSGLLLTGLTAVRTGMSYLVMLAVMSFNVGVLLLAVAGHALGFFIFGTGIFFDRCRAADGGQSNNGDPSIGNKC